MDSSTLWPAPEEVVVDHIIADDQALTLLIHTCQATAVCPDCGQASERIHSRYHRTLADLPWHGVSVQLRLQTRRFFCTNPTCQRRIFTERLPAFVAPYARRTLQLQEALHLIGLALGGRAGARLIQGLGLMSPLAQRDTLLRLIRKQPFVTPPTPRVLGVDDWAFRRGHHYGTILIDLERHRRVDLLPERSAEALATWLKAHPGVEIISRDRCGLYANGARQGAPHAIQVADRWHLLNNLVDTIEGVLLREHRALRQAVHQIRQVQIQAQITEEAENKTPESQVSDTRSPSEVLASARVISKRLAQDKQQRRERRASRYEEVCFLQQQGHSLRAIARLTGHSRVTVRRYTQAGEFPERAIRQPRPSKLTAFVPYLLSRWEAGCHNCVQLYHELCERGYTGKQSVLRDYLSPLRHRKYGKAKWDTGLDSCATPTTPSITIPPPKTLSPRSILWWLLRPDEQLEEEKHRFVTCLCDLSPAVREARELALWFLRIVRERRAEELGDWIQAARDGPVSGLRGFACKLLSDWAEVKAALIYEWSNGQVEGQVNRLKLVKRQMYGRANFDLLRLRVLANV